MNNRSRYKLFYIDPINPAQLQVYFLFETVFLIINVFLFSMFIAMVIKVRCHINLKLIGAFFFTQYFPSLTGRMFILAHQSGFFHSHRKLLDQLVNRTFQLILTGTSGSYSSPGGGATLCPRSLQCEWRYISLLFLCVSLSVSLSLCFSVPLALSLILYPVLQSFLGRIRAPICHVLHRRL